MNSLFEKTNFDGHLKTISEMTEIGETVDRVDTLIKETKIFHSLCGTDIERAEEVLSVGMYSIRNIFMLTFSGIGRRNTK